MADEARTMTLNPTDAETRVLEELSRNKAKAELMVL